MRPRCRRVPRRTAPTSEARRSRRNVRTARHVARRAVPSLSLPLRTGTRRGEPVPPSTWSRVVRWLAVLVPVADLALALTGVLDVRTALLVGVLLEAVLTVVVVAEVRAF